MKIARLRSALWGGLASVLLVLLLGNAGSMQAQSINEIEMVFVPGGTFTMGCTYEQSGACAYDESPAHQVTLTGFTIGKYEVTQALWKQVMGSNPSRNLGDDLPVQNVSWDDVQQFLQRLNQKTGKNYRLPTEAEWEYAARGGAAQTSQFRYSGSAELTDVGWFAGNSESTPHAVGTKQPNSLGIYDMSGNVWEWCSDLYGMYTDKDQKDPKGADKGMARIVRGGCYAAMDKQCRVSTRKNLYQGGKDFATGFRLAMDDDREAKAEAARIAAEKAAAEAAAKAEQERIAAEKAAAEAAKKAEQERIAAEKKAEQERIAAEKAAADAAKQAEQERLAAEKKAEQERIAAEKAAAEAAKQAEQERLAAEKKAEQERIAAEKAAAEAAKQAEQERIAAEKKAEQERIAAEKAAEKAAHQAEVQERLAAIPSVVFFTVNAEIWNQPQWAMGFKVGTMKNVGWYVGVMTNFNYRGMFKPFEEGNHYVLTGKSKSSFLELTAGVTARRYQPVTFLCGVGFAFRSYNLQTDTGKWFRYNRANHIGPVLNVGFMFHIKQFAISLEGTSLFNLNMSNSQRVAFGGNLGIGFAIPYKNNKQQKED